MKKKKASKVPKLKSFLISAGNSSQGPVGFCMRVKAHTKEEAIKLAKYALPTDIEAKDQLWDDGEQDVSRVEYFNVYFNDGALTLADIDVSETEDVEEDE